MGRNTEKYKEYQRKYQQQKRRDNIRDKKYVRTCPKCQNEIIYGTKQTFNYGIKNNSICKTCTARDQLKKIHQEIDEGVRLPLFQGKTHTDETKEKIRNHPNQKLVHTHPNYINRVMPTGTDHHFTGSSFIQCWINKYGSEKADVLLDNYKKKKSKQNSGEGNPMYGRPSPQGSGNGISGWFNGMFFRSLLELNFLVTCHKLNYKVRSAECKEFQVKYPSIDFERNYYPDFILNEKYVVECKPVRLIQTINNQAKIKAAMEKWGSAKFKVISPPKFNIYRIPKLIEEGLIKLTERSKKYLRTKHNLDI